MLKKETNKKPVYFLALYFFLFTISRRLSVMYVLVQLQIISNLGSSTPRKGVGAQY